MGACVVVVVVALVLAVWAAAAFALLNFIISGAHRLSLHRVGVKVSTANIDTPGARRRVQLAFVFFSALAGSSHSVCSSDAIAYAPTDASSPTSPASGRGPRSNQDFRRVIVETLCAGAILGLFRSALLHPVEMSGAKCPRHFDWGMSGAVHFVLGASVQNAPKCPFMAFRSHEVLFCIYR